MTFTSPGSKILDRCMFCGILVKNGLGGQLFTICWVISVCITLVTVLFIRGEICICVSLVCVCWEASDGSKSSSAWFAASYICF